MTIVNGRTYRFTNVYHEGYGLNIYGTSANDIKGGQNVCLYPASASDKMQQWKIEERGSNGYRLHTVMSGKTNYVLDCSDGSISTSYKNNAHMCLETGTTDVDCAVEFEYVGTNRVRIHLGQKGLCLTATTVADNDAELSNNISTSAALRGGSAGRGNVYWASPASEGSMTWKKQCWYVIDVEGESEPEPDPGDDVIIDEPAGVYFSQQNYPWSRPSVISVDDFHKYGCAAVAATMFARIMMNDSSITPEDMYDEGVWKITGGSPFATWNTSNSKKLDFNFIGPISGWSENAAPLIYDEIHANRPVIIWVHGQYGGTKLDTHFVVGYGLKAGATKNGLRYNQVLVHDPWTKDNKTLQDTMNYKDEWSIFGTIRYARAK